MILILPVFLGLIPASIAASKGRNFLLWWLYGAALFIIALPHSIFASRNMLALAQRSEATEQHAKCPSCAEIIKADARICKHCQRDVIPALSAVAA